MEQIAKKKKKKNKEDTYFHQRRILKRISLEKILLLRSRVKIPLKEVSAYDRTD